MSAQGARPVTADSDFRRHLVPSCASKSAVYQTFQRTCQQLRASKRTGVGGPSKP